MALPSVAVVYTDGASKNNQAPEHLRQAGVGVWWGQNDARNISERCPGDQANNRAELIAISRALESSENMNAPLLIKTDSRYSMDCLTKWIRSWIKNGWMTSKKEPVKNVEVIRYIHALMEERLQMGIPVTLEHVKGHAGNEGNVGADKLANEGCFKDRRPDGNWEALTIAVHARMAQRAAGTASANTGVSHVMHPGASTASRTGVTTTSAGTYDESVSQSPRAQPVVVTGAHQPPPTVNSEAAGMQIRPPAMLTSITFDNGEATGPHKSAVLAHATPQTPLMHSRVAAPRTPSTYLPPAPRTPSTRRGPHVPSTPRTPSMRPPSAATTPGGSAGPRGYERIMPDSWELGYADSLFLSLEELRALETRGWEIDGRA